MNQENLVASQWAPGLNVVGDFAWEGPDSPAAWIPGRLLTNPLRDKPFRRQNAGNYPECPRLPAETIARPN
jgi:hypothetical protein